MFERNSAQSAGGALDIINQAVAYVTGCRFLNNTAEQMGGAVCVAVLLVPHTYRAQKCGLVIIGLADIQFI